MTYPPLIREHGGDTAKYLIQQEVYGNTGFLTLRQYFLGKTSGTNP